MNVGATRRTPELGWRMALTLLFPTVFTWIYFVYLAGRSTPILWGFYLAGKTLQFSLPLLLSRGFPGRPARGTVRHGDRRGPDLARGAAFGVAVGAVALAAAAAGVVPEGLAEAARAKVEGLGIASRGRFLVLCISYALGHSFLEEYYWRGFVQEQLQKRLGGFAGPVMLAGVLFGLHHVFLLVGIMGWGLASLCTFGTVVAGWVWSWQLARGASLLDCYISHMVADMAGMWVGWDLVQRGLG